MIVGTRHTDQDFGEGVELKNIDLLADEATLVGELRPLELDAIYFVAGSRGKNLLQIDAFGAVKLEAAADVGHQALYHVVIMALNVTSRMARREYDELQHCEVLW